MQNTILVSPYLDILKNAKYKKIDCIYFWHLHFSNQLHA